MSETYPNLNKTRMREWRDELRRAHKTGIPQTNGALQRFGVHENRTPVGFCCLGILCEAGVKAGWLESRKTAAGYFQYGPNPTSGTYRYDEASETSLPASAQEWLGVTSTDPILLDARPYEGRGDEALMWYSAAGLNDEYRLTFDQIADCMTWTYRLDDE